MLRRRDHTTDRRSAASRRAPSTIARLTLIVLVAAGIGASSEPSARAQAGDPLDVLVVFDNTGSMEGAIDSAAQNVRAIVERISDEHQDSRFGLATVADGDAAWALRVPLTSATDAFIGGLAEVHADAFGGDSPEAYARAVFEARQESMGWRSEAERVVLLVNDDLPKDDDLTEGVPAEIVEAHPLPLVTTGADVSPDGVRLDWQTELGRLGGQGVALAVLFTGDPLYLPYWEWWTSDYTGGLARPFPEASGQSFTDAVVALVRTAADPDPAPLPVAALALGTLAAVAIAGGVAAANTPSRRQRRFLRRHVRLTPVRNGGAHQVDRADGSPGLPAARLQLRPGAVEHRIVQGSGAP